jgi:alkylation response protein AidB-like acyl-CoA dehydrogenase
MNFALSDEQEFLREAARGVLSRHRTLEAARAGLEGEDLPDLWPAAIEAGWPGLVVSEAHDGAGLGALDAMLVMWECGRVLASVPLLGHVPATALLQAAGADGDVLRAVASGETRAAYVPVRPPGDIDRSWSTDPRGGLTRGEAPRVEGGAVTGQASWVPDAPGADLLVVPVLGEDGVPAVAIVEGGDAEVETVQRYDATRSLGHVTLDGAAATVLPVPEEALAGAWYLAQGLLAAEELGGVERALEASVEYAKERHTFGRAIGSYQAVKHMLVEILRLLENARSLMYYAGWASESGPAELALAASATRVAAGKASDHASRTLISVHGGIGATWEHDAPLYFRRSQLSRRLLGGDGDAADRVAGELLTAATAG